MAEFRLVAREEICRKGSITNADNDLISLNGYAELFFETTSEELSNDEKEKAINLINEKSPNHRYKKYDFIKID